MGLTQRGGDVLGITALDGKSLICLCCQKILIGFQLLVVHQLFGLGLGCTVKDGLCAAVLHFRECFHKVVSGFLQLATGQFMGNGLRSRLRFLPVMVGIADKVCGGRIAQFAGEVFS